MGIPCVIKASGGLPVTVATSGYGTPMEVATNGYGIAITQVASGGLPVVGVTFGPSIGLSNNTVYENAAVNTVVGTLSMSGTTGTPTYTLTGTAGGRFKIVGNSLQVALATLDYETASSHGITVSVSGVAPAVSATNFTVVVLDVNAAAPLAPALDLTSAPTDNTPDFTLTGDFVLGDTVRFQYSTASDFSGASELTNTIDAGEDAANSISFSTGALANNTWYFRARIERPDAATGGWSNTESVTLVTPSYSGPGDAVPGAYAWYGLQAYTTASIGANVVELRESGGNTLQTFVSTASGGLDLAAIATFKGANNLFVRTLYDQTGGGRHFTQTTNANQPAFLLNQINGLPALSFNPASSHRMSYASAVSVAAPWTIVSVASFIDGGSIPILCNPATAAVDVLLRAVSANTLQFYVDPTSFTKGSVTDGVVHSISWVANGASSMINVSGVSTTGSLASPGALIGISIGGSGAFGFHNGLVTEFGLYSSLAFSPAQFTAMYANQNARYAV